MSLNLCFVNGLFIGATIMTIVGIILISIYHIKVKELIRELEGVKK